jgi:hypothetical protein
MTPHSSSRLLIALSVALLFCSLSLATDPAVTETQIRRWIGQLDDDRFAVREEATKSLIAAGKPAIAAVAAAADSESLERTDRCFTILTSLAVSDDTAAADAAAKALDGLAASKKSELAAKSKLALRTVESRVVNLLQRDGVVVTYEAGQATRVNCSKATKIGDKVKLLHRMKNLREIYAESKLFGDAELAQLKGVANIDHFDLFTSGITDEGLKYLKDMPGLKSVPMGLTRVTDAGLVHLKDLTQLEYIGLRGNDITGTGLVHLKKLTRLTGLNLRETKVTDAALLHLKPLVNLQSLYLEATAVTDAGLEHLWGMKNLRQLGLKGSQATKEGIERLKKALPELTID